MSRGDVIPAKAGTPKNNTSRPPAQSPVQPKATNTALKQFLKYMAGGGIYFWTGYAIFAVGYSVLHWWWLWAKMLADAVGWSLNYLVQRYWAFAEHHRLSEMQHVARYLTIESIGFVLDYAIIAGLKAIGISPYIGFFISAAFFTVWSYLWYKYWVFPERSKDKS